MSLLFVIVIFIPLRVRILLLIVHQTSSSISGWTENYAEWTGGGWGISQQLKFIRVLELKHGTLCGGTLRLWNLVTWCRRAFHMILGWTRPLTTLPCTKLSWGSASTLKCEKYHILIGMLSSTWLGPSQIVLLSVPWVCSMLGGQKRSLGSPGVGVAEAWELLCGCWALNPAWALLNSSQCT